MRRSSAPTVSETKPDLAQIAERVVWGQFLLMQERERLELAALYACGGWMALPMTVVVLGSPK